MRKGIIFELKNNKAVIITPKGEFLSISADASWRVGDEVTYKQKDMILFNKRTSGQKTLLKKVSLIAIAACLLFFIIPIMPLSQASTYISIDINPSLELELKNSKVINITPINQDALELIAFISDDVIGNDLYNSTLSIIEATQRLGYLKNEENFIIVGVCDNNEEIELENYGEFIKENLAKDNYKVEVIVINGTNEDKKIADDKEISIGKYIVQQDKKNNGIEISDEELKNSEVKEIIKKTNEENKEDNNKENDINKSNNNLDKSNNNYQNNNSNGNSGDSNNKKDNDIDINKENKGNKDVNINVKDKNNENDKNDENDKKANNSSNKNDNEVEKLNSNSNNSGNNKDEALDNKANENTNNSNNNKQSKNESNSNSQKNK